MDKVGSSKKKSILYTIYKGISTIYKKIYRVLLRPVVGSEAIAAEKQLEQYGFHKKHRIVELAVIGLILAGVSLITWSIVVGLEFQRVPWSNAFTAILSLGIAIIAYRQWHAARQEISIDKYYDRLDVANKRLEVVQTDKPSPEDMHAFAELDKLEYVIAKYEYGYMPPVLALRALNNFKGLCRDRRGFREKASCWVNKASYREVTRTVVMAVCERCRPNNTEGVR
jgi:hypothetical protein